MRPCVIVPHCRHETLVVPVLAVLLLGMLIRVGAPEALRQRLGAWLEGLA